MKVFYFILYVLLLPWWIILIFGHNITSFITNIMSKLEELLGDVLDDIEFDIKY